MEKSASLISRWLRISSVLLKYFVFYKISGYRKDNFGKRLSNACEELGPIFVKLGQILSTRYDILSDEDCKELQRLLDKVNPVAFETVQAVIEKDFGQKLSTIFRTFEAAPLASASIAQVHRASLSSGAQVVVKIRRPGIHSTIESDINVLKQVIAIAELFSAELRHVGAKRVVDQLRGWMLQELDFRQEAKNIVRMKKYFIHAMEQTGTPEHEAEQLVIPELYGEYCSENVITMEFIDGIPLSQFERVKDDPNYDVERSAKVCAMFNLRHWLVSRNDEVLFHADPHAANLLLLPRGKLALVDFGLIGVFKPAEARQVADLFLAIYACNQEQVITNLLGVSGASYGKYAAVLRPDIAEYISKVPSTGIGFWVMDLVRLLVKHRVPFPQNLVLLGRENAVVDGLISTVLPGKTTIDIMGGELERALRKKILQNILDTDLSRLAYAVSEEIKRSPEKIASFIDQMAEDPFKIVRDFNRAAKG